MLRLHNKTTTMHESVTPNEIGLENLDIGPPIAKGCSAVVYAANIKEQNNIVKSDELTTLDSGKPPIPECVALNSNFNRENRQISNEPQTVSENSSSGTALSNQNENIEQYPLALKMMFNYDVQSNAMSILRAMYKETIPIIHKYENLGTDSWERALRDQTTNLPSHPNIVTMIGAFCALVPNLAQSTSLYPMALPSRLNPSGYGRNMSLFLLMKRYNNSLCGYLEQIDTNNSMMRTRLLLFAQLLEGVAHLYRYGVAHRDLKSDNILIDTSLEDRFPLLTLSDFGCCIADKYNGLCIPYPSFDIDKGGNTALMAPEIITKMPGKFSILDYSKSDLWACGTIAYEIFGKPNPFYSYENSSALKQLNSLTYEDNDLPPLQAFIPLIVRKLIENILHRNPTKRLSPDVAANVMQLFLWAPSTWLRPTANVSSPEILQWLLSLTTKVLYDTNLEKINSCNTPEMSRSTRTNCTHTEYLLLMSFLMRSQLQLIRNALEWIQKSINCD